MIGGVLVERTVSEVLPSLQNNKEMLFKMIDFFFVFLIIFFSFDQKISQLIESLKSQVVSKGKEITEYMEKHSIQIRPINEPINETQKLNKEEISSVLVDK
jgi:prefoldin subunit 2